MRLLRRRCRHHQRWSGCDYMTIIVEKSTYIHFSKSILHGGWFPFQRNGCMNSDFEKFGFVTRLLRSTKLSIPLSIPLPAVLLKWCESPTTLTLESLLDIDELWLSAERAKEFGVRVQMFCNFKATMMKTWPKNTLWICMGTTTPIMAHCMTDTTCMSSFDCRFWHIKVACHPIVFHAESDVGVGHIRGSQ